MLSYLMEQMVRQHTEDLLREAQRQRILQRLRRADHHGRPGGVTGQSRGRKVGVPA